MLAPARGARILSAELFGGELAELRPVKMKAFETRELLFLRGIEDLAEALLYFRAIVSRRSAAMRGSGAEAQPTSVAAQIRTARGVRFMGWRPNSFSSGIRLVEESRNVLFAKSGIVSLSAMSGTDFIVGIDLGTTNSLIGAMDAGFPVLIADAEGERLTPSVVHFPAHGEPLVGRAAARMRAIDPERRSIR